MSDVSPLTVINLIIEVMRKKTAINYVKFPISIYYMRYIINYDCLCRIYCYFAHFIQISFNLRL